MNVIIIFYSILWYTKLDKSCDIHRLPLDYIDELRRARFSK